MTEARWSDEDDAHAYAEYVADKIGSVLDYALHISLPEAVAAAGRCAAAFADFAAAWRASEMNEVAAHPDLLELDVQLNGFYGDAD